MHLLLAVCCILNVHVHAPSGAPIAHAQIVLSGPAHVIAASDAVGNARIQAPPGRYDLTVTARGFVPATVDTGSIVAASNVVDVALEPSNSPKLRVIDKVTVNGWTALDRNVVPSTVVTRAQMDALGYQNVLESLGEVPSTIIQHPDSGAPTAPAVVSLRGPDPSEALITLDGQVLNDGNTGDVDLSEFAVPAFESVDVTEGLGPMDSESSNTFGGAVNFVSLRPTLAQHVNLSASVGTFGTTQDWINATGMAGKLGYALAGNDYQQAGEVNQSAYVYPVNNAAPLYCSGTVPPGQSPQNCPTLTHLGSTIASRLGLVNLDYNFSQDADLGLRIFTLGDNRDESSAVNGIAGNANCVASNVAGPACGSDVTIPPGTTSVPNPVFGDHIGLGQSIFAQSIRAYDAYSRAPLGSGSLLSDFYASDNNVSYTGGSVSPYDVFHRDGRYDEALSWGRTFDNSEFAFGGYARQESLTGAGISGTSSQSIQSYFVRGSQEIRSNLRLLGGLYESHYSTFGTSLDWRLGASYDLTSSSALNLSAGTGFRAPLLIERYYFPPVFVSGKLEPNPGLPPPDQNCVVAGQGNPNERPEHATEYELGYSQVFSNLASLDVSLYRSNLRDTIENFYPGGGAVNYCGSNSSNGFIYEIPVNIGNAIYEGTEVRYRERFPRQGLLLQLSYGLNAAYPYALGPDVSNPTSGGTLVDDRQFPRVPQQQGSATLTWEQNGWHAATALTLAGYNNMYNQPPYTLVDLAFGKNLGPVDVTVAGTNVFNAISGPFTYYDAGVPYRGLFGPSTAPFMANLPTDRLFLPPAAVHLIVTIHE
jgi:outer membrane cobalamin receptor